ncbi:MAG: response regulator [Anaerolineales bacterium]|jgi:CheY-like chemotaxis protein|nr:response regulator [Anaerolineales bacterium]
MREKILIVEDEAINAMSLRVSLERFGYEVCELVSTGERAVLVAERDNPDAVIMDINLAGRMDGLEAAQIIFSRRKTPIIFLTGYTDDEVFESACSFEGAVCIVKPADSDDVRRAIETVLTGGT